MISDATINKVREVPIEEIVRPYTTLKKQGASLMGLCPFHQERTGSFSVTPGKNLYHCFSCLRGGDGINFIMEKENLSFMDAVEFIARKHGIPVERVNEEENEKETAAANHREKLLIALENIQEFYVRSLSDKSSVESRMARDYAYGRWPDDFCTMTGIGYAPQDSRPFMDYCTKKCIDENTLLELGMLRKSDDGRTYALFRGRIMIPIRNRWGRVIAYTGRYTAKNDKVPKYINSTNSPVYTKGETLFGIDRASRCRKADYFIIVEGAPDVLRMQSIGFENTVAALGTAWTYSQFSRLKKLTDSVCFVPDSDVPDGRSYGPGFESVMKNGALAMRKGFSVTVRELPFATKESVDEETGEVTQVTAKNDADSFIHCKEDFLLLKEKYFIVWMAEKRFAEASSMTADRQCVSEIADLMRFVKDQLAFDQCISQLSKIHGKPKLWKDAVSQARGEARRNKKDTSGMNEKQRETEELRQLGIFVRDNCYYTIGDEDNDPSRISNFIMEPLFHIKDENNGRRLFLMKNTDNISQMIELKESDMCNLSNFQQKTGSLGNFVWRSKIDKLTALKEYLYANTESAEMVDVLGWNEDHDFFAFGNGILSKGEFLPVNDLGIVRTKDGKAFYLPATSKLFAQNKGMFQFERLMVHEDRNGIRLREFVTRLHTVFGENADIAFCYLLSTLFRDVIFSKTRHFPILNLFGEKGTGKTTLATCLQSFFLHGVDPPNLGVTSVPAMNDRVSQAVNTLTIFDEYKNDLDVRKIAYLKGLWGGGGQTKKNLNTDGMAAQTIITTGIALCGQDKPTQDMALYTRVLFLAFTKTSFNQTERRNYEDLVAACNMGLTHLTIEILKYRELFEKNFPESYAITKRELSAKLDGEEIHDRIFGNWVIPLAAFRTLETVLDVPFSYSELFTTAIRGVREQNELAQESSEISDFWNMLQGFQTSGKCVQDAHYKIRYVRKFRPLSLKEDMEFKESRPILYLNAAAVSSLFSSRSTNSTANRSNWSTILSYLKSHGSYLGLKQERFRILLSNGQPDYIYEDVDGRQVKRVKANRPKALCFDYQALKDSFGLDLETEIINDGQDDEDTDNQADKPRGSEKEPQELPF